MHLARFLEARPSRTTDHVTLLILQGPAMEVYWLPSSWDVALPGNVEK
jgi:hypothetical protein